MAGQIRRSQHHANSLSFPTSSRQAVVKLIACVAGEIHRLAWRNLAKLIAPRATVAVDFANGSFDEKT
jgi:hypothetical protein